MGKLPGMTDNHIAREIERRMKALRLNRKQLSQKAGLNETFVRDLLNGKSKNPRGDSLAKLAAVLGCSVTDLLRDAYNTSLRPRNGSATVMIPREMASIDEIDVRASGGPGQIIDEERKIGEWQLPRDLVRLATNSPTNRIKILSIVGDSMLPTYAPTDRILVDTGDCQPSPPGIFVVWDGLGFVVKRVEYIPHSEPPRVRIVSDNPHYSPYERTIDEAYIQGRVVGKWLWQ